MDAASAPRALTIREGDQVDIWRSNGAWSECTVVSVTTDKVIVSFDGQGKTIPSQDVISYLRRKASIEFTEDWAEQLQRAALMLSPDGKKEVHCYDRDELKLRVHQFRDSRGPRFELHKRDIPDQSKFPLLLKATMTREGTWETPFGGVQIAGNTVTHLDVSHSISSINWLSPTQVEGHFYNAQYRKRGQFRWTFDDLESDQFTGTWSWDDGSPASPEGWRGRRKVNEWNETQTCLIGRNCWEEVTELLENTKVECFWQKDVSQAVHVLNSGTISCRRQVTYTFQVGEQLGIKCSSDGWVTEVEHGGQADKNGVKAQHRILKVGYAPFSEETLKAFIGRVSLGGDSPTTDTITFQVDGEAECCIVGSASESSVSLLYKYGMHDMARSVLRQLEQLCMERRLQYKKQMQQKELPHQVLEELNMKEKKIKELFDQVLKELEELEKVTWATRGFLPQTLQEDTATWLLSGERGKCAKKMFQSQMDDVNNPDRGTAYHSIADYCTRAHLLMRQATWIKYSMGLLFVLIVFVFSNGDGISPLSAKFTLAVLGAGTVVFLLWVEIACMQWTILPWQYEVEEFDLLVFRNLSFRAWWIGCCCISSLSHVSHLWNAAVLGASLKSMTGEFMVHHIFTDGSTKYPRWYLKLAVGLLGASQLAHTSFRHFPIPECYAKKLTNKKQPYYAWIGKERPALSCSCMETNLIDRPRNPEVGGRNYNEKAEIRYLSIAATTIDKKWQSTHFEALLAWARAANCVATTRMFPSMDLKLMDKQLSSVSSTDVRRGLNRAKYIVRNLACDVIISGVFVECSAMLYQTYLLKVECAAHNRIALLFLMISTAVRRAPNIYLCVRLAWSSCRATKRDEERCPHINFMVCWAGLLLLLATASILCCEYNALSTILRRSACQPDSIEALPSTMPSGFRAYV